MTDVLINMTRDKMKAEKKAARRKLLDESHSRDHRQPRRGGCTT
jgi:hypothetical protein